MTHARPQPLPSDRTITVPLGAALIYVSDGDEPTTIILDRADPDYMASRDRVVCSALVAYVSEQLNYREDTL